MKLTKTQLKKVRTTQEEPCSPDSRVKQDDARLVWGLLRGCTVIQSRVAEGSARGWRSGEGWSLVFVVYEWPVLGAALPLVQTRGQPSGFLEGFGASLDSASS